MKNNKSLGQHWLKNRAILDEIAALAADEGAWLDSDNTEVELQKLARLAVEIGPGLGTLTSSLLKKFDKVIAVEYDARLAQNLPKSFPGKNLEVVNADILQYDFTTIAELYVVVGNIPYYITSPIIEKLITLNNAPERIVLLVQKEVAERIAAERETMLSLMVKNCADVALGPVVGKQEFTPRKKLVHNLAGLMPKDELVQIFAKCGISVDARPGDAHLPEWQKLYKEIA